VKINYNQELDILVIEEEDYDDYEESVAINGFIIDLDSNSNFLGVEIMGASHKFDGELSDPEKLENIDQKQINLKIADEIASKSQLTEQGIEKISQKINKEISNQLLEKLGS